MRAIYVERCGGPDVLQCTEISVPEPGEGEALVRVTAAGVNFIDVYYRTGLYPSALPFIAGQEASGVVQGLGRGVTWPRVGDQVAWATHRGSYSEYAAVPASELVPLPSSIDDRVAAAVLLQGMAASYLTSDTYPVRPGDIVLIHAAAGGLGQVLSQMALQRGAQVIGTVSTARKATVAHDLGIEHIILYEDMDFASEVSRLTRGRGVDVVYDSVGRTTFAGSLRSLRPRGHLVLCGLSSGPIPPFDVNELQRHGSLYVTRTSMADYVSERKPLLAHASAVFKAVASGKLRVRIHEAYDLADAPLAHRALEARETLGKLLLIP